MRQRVLTLLERYIFADELPLDARRINIMLAFGFLVAVGCTIMRIIEGAGLASLLLQTCFILLVIMGALAVTVFKLYTLSIYVTVISLNFVLFPLAFFFNGGLATGMPAFFAMGIALIALLLGNRKILIPIILNILWIIGCYLLAHYCPQLVLKPTTPLLSEIDHIGSFLMVSLFIGAVIKIQDRLYEMERVKSVKAAELLTRHNRLSAAVNEMATALLNTEIDNFEAAFQQSVGKLALCIGVDRATIWRNTERDGHVFFRSLFQWAQEDFSGQKVPEFAYDSTPTWFETLSQGGTVGGPLSRMNPKIQETLAPYGIRSLLLVPAFYQNRFEGFVSFDDCRNEREFVPEEIEILHSAALILANALVRNEVNASLVLAREDALAGNRTKDEFLSNMSHEMRTPLNAIMGMLAIAKNTTDQKRQALCLERMEEASTHLLGIINDLLAMSAIEANKLDLSNSDFSLDTLINHAVAINSFLINRKKLKLQLEFDPAIPDNLYGDEQRVSQVISNVLSNAVKFTPTDGTVTLLAQLIESTPDGTHHIGVTVADTGIGIDEKQIERLFEPFQQAESSPSRRFGGAGLGLALSKRILDMEGGSISVRSEVGKGTTVELIFPLADGRGRAESNKADKVPEGAPGFSWSGMADAIAGLEGHRILLAEDVEVNKEIVFALLEPAGLHLQCASNGIEAVQLFEQDPERYDLIFMDMQMPEMDGCEAARRIRSGTHPKAQSIPIIALTANVFKEDISECLAAGMNGHLGKPLDPVQVFATLRKYLQ